MVDNLWSVHVSDVKIHCIMKFLCLFEILIQIHERPHILELMTSNLFHWFKWWKWTKAFADKIQPSCFHYDQCLNGQVPEIPRNFNRKPKIIMAEVQHSPLMWDTNMLGNYYCQKYMPKPCSPHLSMLLCMNHLLSLLFNLRQ